MRKVFFSFHYKRDIQRVSVVRNSWRIRHKGEATPFLDHADWEQLEKQGEEAVKRWINAQLDGSTVTVVLIGAETVSRYWVNYEIERSHNLNHGLLGICLNNIPDFSGATEYRGGNPFSNWYTEKGLYREYFSNIYPVYDWINDNGFLNFADWIEEAATKAGR